MDNRKKILAIEHDYESFWSLIVRRVREGEIISAENVWDKLIAFDKPKGITAYNCGSGNVALGILPFYDFIYSPISMDIYDENDFVKVYGFNTAYFLDLCVAGKIIPVFHADSTLYSDFIINELWSILESKNLKYLLAHQINSLCIAFQSSSKILLPWEDKEKDPWWTEMMIKSSALNGKVIAGFPKDIKKFLKKKSDFDKIPSEIRKSLNFLDGEKLNFISRAIGLAYSNNIPSSKYLEIFDSKLSQNLRNVFEEKTTLINSDKDNLIDICKNYNKQIEDITKSSGFKAMRIISDIFSKHILTISLGLLGTSLGGNIVPGLAGLVAGEVISKSIDEVKNKLDEFGKKTSRTLTENIFYLLGKDSNLIHLVLKKEQVNNLS